ncbi:hypothetical protein [Tropicimonas sp. IMCC34043]|uniref:hypothetical protein n=1 Tax=Tropicimonas sp. IMCC34043 TaxID=2248760 RepID=UPI000E27B0F2|nr:hypothetical protein [Tropicimonas sp. IMCC34043]
MARIVLILGSGPDAVAARAWPAAAFDARVAINNAWRVRPDWTHLIHPEDFPEDRRPQALSPGQQIVDYRSYVPAQNRFGGFVYAGGTMAFTAGYWALDALRPRVMAFVGCDMVYPATGPTHFYGTGAPDPLRRDPTLRSLPAKSARLALLAARRGCVCVNLSAAAESRLVFARTGLGDLPVLCRRTVDGAADALAGRPLSLERRLGYFVASGRYWKQAAGFDTAALDAIDAAWLAAWRAHPLAGRGQG